MGGKLITLAEMLNSDYCVCHANGQYPLLKDGVITPVQAIETLEVRREIPQERLVIGYFGYDTPTGVAYLGENAKSARETVRRLRLPSGWPSNLGEKVFFRFRGRIKKAGDQDFYLEERVISDLEHEFEFLLRKLVHVYSGKEINEEFFRALKQQRK